MKKILSIIVFGLFALALPVCAQVKVVSDGVYKTANAAAQIKVHNAGIWKSGKQVFVYNSGTWFPVYKLPPIELTETALTGWVMQYYSPYQNMNVESNSGFVTINTGTPPYIATTERVDGMLIATHVINTGTNPWRWYYYGDGNLPANSVRNGFFRIKIVDANNVATYSDDIEVTLENMTNQ